MLFPTVLYFLGGDAYPHFPHALQEDDGSQVRGCHKRVCSFWYRDKP